MKDVKSGISSGLKESNLESSKDGIMIVDDSKFSRNILNDILKTEGFQVIAEARNGLEAVDMTRDKKPKYIFMDVEMPVLDGLGAIPKILEVDPEVHIIMCTAMGQKNIILEAARAGAKDYVLKPYKRENIVRVLGIIIESQKKKERAEQAEAAKKLEIGKKKTAHKEDDLLAEVAVTQEADEADAEVISEIPEIADITVITDSAVDTDTTDALETAENIEGMEMPELAVEADASEMVETSEYINSMEMPELAVEADASETVEASEYINSMEMPELAVEADASEMVEASEYINSIEMPELAAEADASRTVGVAEYINSMEMPELAVEADASETVGAAEYINSMEMPELAVDADASGTVGAAEFINSIEMPWLEVDLDEAEMVGAAEFIDSLEIRELVFDVDIEETIVTLENMDSMEMPDAAVDEVLIDTVNTSVFIDLAEKQDSANHAEALEAATVAEAVDTAEILSVADDATEIPLNNNVEAILDSVTKQSLVENEEAFSVVTDQDILELMEYMEESEEDEDQEFFSILEPEDMPQKIRSHRGAKSSVLEDRTDRVYDYQTLSYLWLNRFDLLFDKNGEIAKSNIIMINMRRLLNEHAELEEMDRPIQKLIKGLSAAYLCKGNRLQPVELNHEQDKKPYIEENRYFSGHILENRSYLKRDISMSDIQSSGGNVDCNKVVILRPALNSAIRTLVEGKTDRRIQDKI